MRGFPRAKIKCQTCGREFDVIYKWRNKKYCGMDCYGKKRLELWEKHKEEIISLFKQGYGIWTLEERFGVGHKLIDEKMKELGIIPNPNSRSLTKNMLDLSPSDALYYVLGCCYGDASAYRYQHPQCENAEVCRLEMTCKDRDFIEAFDENCQRIGLNTHSITQKPSKTTNQGFLWKVCIDSKAFVDFWDSITDEQMLGLPQEYKIPFIRGIFDSDGCFYHRKNMKAGISTAREIRAEFLKELVEKMGFKAGIYKSEYNNYQIENPNGFKSNNPFKYSIEIQGGKPEVQRFLETIQPNIERKRWAS